MVQFNSRLNAYGETTGTCIKKNKLQRNDIKVERQTYGFPQQHSKTMLPAVFWLFYDIQKVKKTDPTYAAHVQDGRGRGVFGSNMVVVAKKVKKSFTS